MNSSEKTALTELVHEANVSYMSYMCKEVDKAIQDPIDKVLRREEYIAEYIANNGYRRESDVAKEIFDKIRPKIGFDGHNISVWKCELVDIAKDYGIVL